MRLLADENVEATIVKALREAGFDVLEVASDSPGAQDSEVLDRAEAEGRIILTNDKDFAELAFLQRRAKAGIVLMRLPAKPSLKARRVLEVLEGAEEKLTGALTVVQPTARRRRPFG